MPRKIKISVDHNEQPNGASAANGNGNAGQPPPPAKNKRAPRRKAKAKQVAARDIDATTRQISDEALRLRAYFIAEERARRGLPGDEHSDWLEARRQLIAELR